MNNMFKDCISLQKINFVNFNTTKVKDMSYMFYGCRSLQKLNPFNFNTNIVINNELYVL